ncbi:MAG: LysE family translocator [Desulfovibrionaceae bacterium]
MIENMVPFLAFVVAMTATPGPGNLAMMSIGQSTGFRSAVPFLLGTAVGCVILDGGVALGVGAWIVASPLAGVVLRVAGSAYILYLAVKLVRLRPVAPEAGVGGARRGFTFWEGLLVHPLSPKSWAMAVVGFAQFMSPTEPYATQAMVFVGAFLVGLLVFHSLWCAAGATLLGLLRAPRVRVAVNAALVALMLGATAWAMAA